jgi:hypothetical protein
MGIYLNRKSLVADEEHISRCHLNNAVPLPYWTKKCYIYAPTMFRMSRWEHYCPPVNLHRAHKFGVNHAQLCECINIKYNNAPRVKHT